MSFMNQRKGKFSCLMYGICSVYGICSINTEYYYYDTAEVQLS